MEKLNRSFIISILLHIVIIALFLLLAKEKKEEPSSPLIADIITAEEPPKSLPPQSSSRASRGLRTPRSSAKTPSQPSRPAPRREPRTAKKTDEQVREKVSPRGELPSAGSRVEKPSPSTQTPGSVASLPSQPSKPSPPASQGAPYVPLREKLFDRDVIGKLAQRRREEEKPDNGITFDTKDFKYQGYMKRLRERIESIWRYPPEAAEKGLYGDLYIKFTIKKNGRLGAVELERTSGYKVLDDAALKALKEAEPYWPLPDDWQEEDGFTITGHFVYTMYGFGIR